MKVIVVLLVCSLAANAAWLVRRGISRAAYAPESRSVASVAELSPNDEREIVATLFDLGRTDAATLKTHLEAAGFPPEVARAAAAAQVQHDFRQRQAALVGSVEPPPFWQTSAGFVIPTPSGNPETERQLNELRRELTARMKEIMGSEHSPEDVTAVSQSNRWGSLPREKMSAVLQINSDYQELQRELLAGRSPMTLPAVDQEKLALLNRERRADIEAVLTPAELFEMDVRQSPTASRLRSQLRAFNASEEEFRAIFQVQYELDRESGRDATHAGITIISSSDRDTNRNALLERVKPILSPERYADFEFATTSANTMLVAITNRFGLPVDAARSVVATRDEVTQAAAKLRADPSLSPVERNTRLAELSRTAAERISGTLGQRGYEAYLENGGAWINQLSGVRVPSPSP